LNFVQVSAGFSHTCGVTPAEAAYCWGSNANGGLGDGTSVERGVPTLVVGSAHFLQVSAGNEFTCGVAVDRWVYCWGTNVFGQLGDGTTLERHTPTPVVS
jgi:alpha-tubulin suppressor-like RCC1 family protein